jgi:ribosomal protein L18
MKREINTRLRRARHIRRKIIGLQADRLCVHRTPRHIYAPDHRQDGRQQVNGIHGRNGCAWPFRR